MPQIVKQETHLEFITPNALQLIERAGRTAYKSEDKITEDSAINFVKMIINRGHESVLEHAYASIRVITNRGVSHEIVRHRIDSFTQESTRYCDYTQGKFDGKIKVIPPLNINEEQYNIWLKSMEQSEEAYRQLILSGTSAQIARDVLPNALKTEMVWTANFREWRHILKMRLSPQAHPLMRELAGMIANILMSYYPVVFEDIVNLYKE